MNSTYNCFEEVWSAQSSLLLERRMRKLVIGYALYKPNVVSGAGGRDGSYRLDATEHNSCAIYTDTIPLRPDKGGSVFNFKVKIEKSKVKS